MAHSHDRGREQLKPCNLRVSITCNLLPLWHHQSQVFDVGKAIFIHKEIPLQCQKPRCHVIFIQNYIFLERKVKLQRIADISKCYTVQVTYVKDDRFLSSIHCTAKILFSNFGIQYTSTHVYFMQCLRKCNFDLPMYIYICTLYILVACISLTNWTYSTVFDIFLSK